MAMGQNLLLKAHITLTDGNYTDDEIKGLYNELKKTDKRTLRKYYNKQSLNTYENDLDLYLDVIKKLYKVIENEDQLHHIVK